MANSCDMIDDLEFVLLYDYYKSTNPDIQHWRYIFNFENLNEDECKLNF